MCVCVASQSVSLSRVCMHCIYEEWMGSIECRKDRVRQRRERAGRTSRRYRLPNEYIITVFASLIQSHFFPIHPSIYPAQPASHSFIRSVHSFIHSFICLFVLSLGHSLTHSFARSFDHSNPLFAMCACASFHSNLIIKIDVRITKTVNSFVCFSWCCWWCCDRHCYCHCYYYYYFFHCFGTPFSIVIVTVIYLLSLSFFPSFGTNRSEIFPSTSIWYWH